jgi:PAS domain S-box-containing protein
MLALKAPIARLHVLAGNLDRRANVFQRLFLLAAMTAVPIVTIGWLFWNEVAIDLADVESERRGLRAAEELWPEFKANAGGIVGCARQIKTACSDLGRIKDHQREFNQIAASSRLQNDPEPVALKLFNTTLCDAPAALAADAAFVRALGLDRVAAEPGMTWFTLGATQKALEELLASAAQSAEGDSLRAELELLSQATADYSFSARMLALAPETNAADLADFESDRAQFLAALDGVWRVSARSLHESLQERVNDIHGRLALAGLFSALALSIAGVLMSIIARSILAPQRALVASMNDICNVRLHARVPYRDHENEIGEMARAVEIFRTAMIDRQMLAQHLELERALLERKVDLRTIEVAEAAACAEAAARQLAMALSTAKAGAWGVDLSTGKLWMSPEAEALCGANFTQNNFQGGFWMVLIEEDRARASDVMRRFIQDREPRVETDLRIRRPDGELRWLQATLERVHDGAGLGLFVDITERKRQELRLQAASKAADGANQAKSEFLAMMSHEIRTPLNGMLGMSAALSATTLDKRQREMVAVINQSGDVLLTLLKDVLDLSKIEAGRMDLESLPFDPRQAVQSVATLYSQAARDKGLDLSVEMQGEIPAAIEGDAIRVRQILQNLASNALKFTESGHVIIRLRARTMDDCAVARLRFEVEDTGCGLTPEQMTRIFDRFAQAESSISRRCGGTGLGLSICRTLAELMGGEVGVTSNVGVGSTFWFESTFPLVAASADAQAPDEVTALDTDALHILAADDNETNRFVLSTLLEQVGVRADFACNGAEAVELAQTRTYDVILMDIHMPVMDGFEATRRIRETPGPSAQTPIVALTADAMAEHTKGYRAAGMIDVVAKPIQLASLIAAIAHALQPDGASECDPCPVAKDAA